MNFKELHIQGFKSFAEKLTMQFLPGITAIVGPNGSGKSNISDALKWVMGETSAKMLRGGKMEDVIFSGTEKRSPVGFCEVTIVINNEDKTLASEHNEVSITRRMYRSGESEYYINRKTCRLKDIHELFMDTGLGRDGYSIIGQGMIDSIITAKSDDRRFIFDEAAGITKYRYRKAETNKKLDAAKDNLQRVNDILFELEQRVEPLKVHSEKAKKYLHLYEQQKNIEINLWLIHIDKHKELLQGMKNDYEIAKAQSDRAEATCKELEVEIANLKAKLRTLDGELDLSLSNLYKSENDKQRLESEIENLHSTGNMRKETFEKNKGQILLINEKCLRVEGTIKSFKDEISELNREKEEIKSEISELNQKLTAAKNIQNEKMLNEESKKEAFAKILNDITANSSKKEGIIKLIENISNSLASNMERLNEQRKKAGETANNIDLINKDKESAKAKIKNFEEGLQKINLALFEEKRGELLKKIDNADVFKEMLQNKREMLIKLENNFDGYYAGVKAVMNAYSANNLGGAVIYGTLAKLINTDKRYITAVEAALGAALQNIVTKTEDDAKKAIEFLKKTKAGRVTFLPCNVIKPRNNVEDEFNVENDDGYVSNAAEVIDTDPKFINIIKNMLSRTIIADNIDSGINIARKHGFKFRIVTLGGEIINAGGAITGGSVKVEQGLSRRVEIEELKNKISAAAEEKKELEKELEKAERLYRESKAAYEKENQSLLAEQSAMAALTAKSEAFSENLAALLKNISDSEKIIEAEENQKKEAKAAVLEIDKNTEELLYLKEKYQQEIKIISENKDDESEAKESINKEIMDKTIMLSALDNEIELRNRRIEDSRRDKADLEAESLILSKETEQLGLLQSGYLKDVEDKTLQISTLLKEYEKLKNLIDEKKAGKQAMQEELDEKEARVKRLTDDSFILQKEFMKIETKKIKAQSDADVLISKLFDDYELTFDSAAVYRREISSIAEEQKEVRKIKDEIKELGNINIDAIEEYKEVKERYDFLNTQREDLLQSSDALLKMMDEITGHMKKQFEEKFEELKICFNETFNSLFGGGKVLLKLSDPSNILESGIDIEAQPPGKKLQSLLLLSGGEKALTAIALIFAILKMKPTYFCIFDEIDAALDDVNVAKYAEFLKKVSSKTQFIIITHRKHTMEAASMLYGVTMQEKGVSSLLELNVSNM